jgi:ABC-type transport system involved in multi-copper enzyme maturation permease subunit
MVLRLQDSGLCNMKQDRLITKSIVMFNLTKDQEPRPIKYFIFPHPHVLYIAMMGAPILSLIRHLLVLHLYTKQSQLMETSWRTLYVGVVIVLLIVITGDGMCTCIRSHKLLLNQSSLSLALANVCMHVRLLTRDKNGMEISCTEPHRFLHLIRSNSYFQTNSNSV